MLVKLCCRFSMEEQTTFIPWTVFLVPALPLRFLLLSLTLSWFLLFYLASARVVFWLSTYYVIHIPISTSWNISFLPPPSHAVLLFHSTYSILIYSLRTFTFIQVKCLLIHSTQSDTALFQEQFIWHKSYTLLSKYFALPGYIRVD